MTLELCLSVLWCLAKPVVLMIIPTLLLGEYILFGNSKKQKSQSI